MDLAIGIRRAIVKNELFMSCVGLQFLLTLAPPPKNKTPSPKGRGLTRGTTLMTGLSCHFVWDNGHKTGHSTVISMTSSGVIFFLISFCPGSHPPRIALPEMGSTVSLIALSIYADIIHSRSGYVNHLGKEKISSVPDPAAPWLHRAGCLQQRRR